LAECILQYIATSLQKDLCNATDVTSLDIQQSGAAATVGAYTAHPSTTLARTALIGILMIAIIAATAKVTILQDHRPAQLIKKP
jgi:hypothetical protein